MKEAAFPLLGTAFVMLVVLPASALIAKGVLFALERKGAGGFLHRLNLRYVVLAGSSVLPLGWFLSASLHQVEAGSVPPCILDHEAAALCFEPGYFAATLGLLLALLSLKSVRGAGRARRARSVGARQLELRAGAIAAAHEPLHGLVGRLWVTEDGGFALGTQGLLRPQVALGRAFAEGLSDDALASALGHEAEHLRALDPLRYLMLSVVLAVNPFGRWLLEPHAGRWLGAREAHCDREAVLRGASPLSLAEAILRAARPVPAESAALGASDTSMLKFRIGMLLAFTERHPEPCCRRGPSAVPAALMLILVALLLPHHTGTEALDAVHTGAEHAVTYILR